MASKTFRKLQVVKLTNKFEKATQIVDVPLRPPKSNEALVKVYYVGVNATDVNITAGTFFDKSVPFDLGLEALGRIEQLGADMRSTAERYGLKEGSPVLYMGDIGYAEYLYITEKELKTTLFAVPNLKPEYLVFGISGLTASIGLTKGAGLKKGDTVLITAAAGGLGHMAIQWAKINGAHVIGTVSTREKVDLASGLGCDRVINYKTEDLDQVLGKEYPNGIDLIWETVGGNVRNILFEHLAVRGRMITLGSISNYMSKGKSNPIPDYDAKVQKKALTLTHFGILSHTDKYSQYLKQLVELYRASKIKPHLDFGEKAPDGPFRGGLQDVAKGVNWLHSGSSIGKVMVQISQ